MPIQLTKEQCASLAQEGESPLWVIAPTNGARFILLKEEVYERVKSLFEEDPITEQERLFQLEQFGKRAGWDDPERDIYNELDPRRKQ